MAWLKDIGDQMANTMIIHARLSKKFFYYTVKYTQCIHDVIPVKDLNDKDGLPCTPYQLVNDRKPSARLLYFRYG